MTRDREHHMKNSYTWVIVIIFMVFFYFIFTWSLDISVSAIGNNGIDGASLAFLTNGFWNTNPTQMYHISLYVTSIVFMFMTFWVLRERALSDSKARERVMRELGITEEALS